MKVFIALAALLCAFNAWAANLIVSEGFLVGATGVIVQGERYRVDFIEGTCAEVFSGCDEPDDAIVPLGWNSALPQQVFIDSELGLFRSNLELVKGCSPSASHDDTCIFLQFLEPTSGLLGTAARYEITVDGLLRRLSVIQVPNTPETAGLFIAQPVQAGSVWIKWTPTPVPLPASVWLFLSAFGALFARSNAGAITRALKRKTQPKALTTPAALC